VSPRVMTVCAALIGVALSMSSATAQTAIRIDDVEVGEQMEQVQRVLDRFIGGLRPPVRAAAAQGGQGGADVASALNGLRTSAARMAAAYRPPTRNATEEVARFLAQAKAIQPGPALTPDGKAAEARWAPVVESFVYLGQAYHIDWRADAASWVPRRVSDQELRLAVSSLRVATHDLDGMLGSTLEKDKLMDRTERARATQLLKTLSSAIRDLLKAFEHYDDLSIALPRAQKAAAGLKPFMETYVGASPIQPQWQSANRALDTLAQGFGL
jgi:hypothetical protein